MPSNVGIPAINTNFSAFIKRLSLGIVFDVRENYLHLEPVFVPVQSQNEYSALRCWFNAYDYALQYNQEVIFGWCFWYSKKQGYLAQHHAVCRKDGGLVDVTPNELNSESILFAPDERVSFDYQELQAPYSFQELPSGLSFWSDGSRRLDRFGFSSISIDKNDINFFKSKSALTKFVQSGSPSN